MAAGGVLQDGSSTTETGRVRGGGDVAVGCADRRADGGYSFQLKSEMGCFTEEPRTEPFKPGEYGCEIAESAPFGWDGGAARGKCYVTADGGYGCYCCLDGGSATPEGFFPYETVGNPVPKCTVF